MADNGKFSFSESLGGPSVTSDGATGGQPGNGGNAPANNDSNNASGETGANPADFVPKKRGRKAFPRDAQGNIIRPEGGNPQGAAPGKAAGKKSEGVALGEYKPNNRPVLHNNIYGMHFAVATLTKQPVFQLSAEEATALTDSLANVLDYHKINITDGGGVWGLYVALGLTAFGIYKPRLTFIKNGGNRIPQERASAPATAEEAEIVIPPNGVSFENDIDVTGAATGPIN